MTASVRLLRSSLFTAGIFCFPHPRGRNQAAESFKRDKDPAHVTARPETHGHQHPEPTPHRKSGALDIRCTPLCCTLAEIFGWDHQRSALIGGCECQPLCMLKFGKRCCKQVMRTLGPVTLCDSTLAKGKIK